MAVPPPDRDLRGRAPDSIVDAPLRGSHPGATVRIGELVDKDLRAEIDGLYVCDASVIPEPMGLPPVLMLIGLGKHEGAKVYHKAIREHGFAEIVRSVAGEVFSKAGASVVNIPGGEILPAGERGVIDAAEWVTPGEDMKMGLHEVWKNYYLPGMHESTTVAELIVNQDSAGGQSIKT